METLKRPRDTNNFSSSPAFGTPLHPIEPVQARRPPAPPVFKPSIATVLPILLPPPTLRPLAFRTFTKKHNLTLNTSALQALATFIGRHCGSTWREEGTGEKVLEEVAKLWKAEGGGVIVEDGERLKGILKALEGSITGGRIGVVKTPTSNLSRQSSFAFGHDSAVDLSDTSQRPSLGGRDSSFGISRLQVEAEEERDAEDEGSRDPRAWLKVISASDQPRFSYDVDSKHFIPLSSKPSMFPSASHKTAMFRERYNIIYQRLLRNEAFQAPSIASSNGLSRVTTNTNNSFYKITPISNLLGRAGSSHLLLGMLAIAPTGTLALNDPSGSISLDLQHAQALQNSFFCPGMIVLVDGVYEDDFSGPGSSGLGNTGGVGGIIGGKFLGFSIGGPPVEKRNVSLGIDVKTGDQGGGFGWTDFLGTGSDRAVGPKMRRIERKMLSSQVESDSQEVVDVGPRTIMVVLSEVTLDRPHTPLALRRMLTQYAASPDNLPLSFLLMGNFTSTPAIANTTPNSIEYKELFDSLAAVLSDFPSLLRNCTWIFVPGDNDPWSSSFSAGASTMIPRDGIPDVFTSRIKRVFANAKAEPGVTRGEKDVECVWTSNPCRLSMFGPAHEMVLFRDDVSGRFRRNAIRVGQAVKANDAEAPARFNGAGQDGEAATMSGALPTTETSTDPEVADAMALDDPEEPTDQQALESKTEAETAEDYPTALAKKTILSILPQSTLSPFPLTSRPTHWNYSTASGPLSLYPLPHTLVLADSEQKAFSLVFEGCCVMNPGSFVTGPGKGARMQWVEYDMWTKRGAVKGEWVD